MGVVVFTKVQWPEVTFSNVSDKITSCLFTRLLRSIFFQSFIKKRLKKCHFILPRGYEGNINYWHSYMLDSKKFEQISGKVMQMALTQPNSEIICAQNVGTKVVCGMILFSEKKAMLKIWKKIVGALLKLPAK